MEDRGLLTDDDRAFFKGERPTDDPDKTRREKLFHIRRRIEHMNDDIDILRDAGEDEAVQYLYTVVGRYERLERKLNDLQNQLDELE